MSPRPPARVGSIETSISFRGGARSSSCTGFPAPARRRAQPHGRPGCSVVGHRDRGRGGDLRDAVLRQLIVTTENNVVAKRYPKEPSSFSIQRGIACMRHGRSRHTWLASFISLTFSSSKRELLAILRPHVGGQVGRAIGQGLLDQAIVVARRASVSCDSWLRPAHASIKLTVDTYGKWLPLGSKDAVDRLDHGVGAEAGTSLVAKW